MAINTQFLNPLKGIAAGIKSGFAGIGKGLQYGENFRQNIINSGTPSFSPPANQTMNFPINTQNGAPQPIRPPNNAVPQKSNSNVAGAARPPGQISAATVGVPNPEADARRASDAAALDKLKNESTNIATTGFAQPKPTNDSIGMQNYSDPKLPQNPVNDKMAQLEATRQAYISSLGTSPDEASAQKELDNLSQSKELGLAGIAEQPIEMGFVTGQQANLERRTALQALPLQARLAAAQAQRSSTQAQNKASLDFATEDASGQYGGNKPIEVGGNLVQYNPQTGSYDTVFKGADKANSPVTLGEGQILIDPTTGEQIAAGNPKSNASADPSRVLSATEAQSLGVAFGTTAGQAYGLSPQKPLTEAQGKDLTYANRAGQSNAVIDQYAQTIASYNPLLWSGYKAAENTSLGNTIVPDVVRQVRQAERDFITSILRRESGATISPTEFSVAEKQYFPQPGDDAGTLAQKTQLRNTAIAAFKRSAGSGYEDINGGSSSDTGYADSW